MSRKPQDPIKAFQQTVWDYFKNHGRSHLPWRVNLDPYGIFVSEVMLQQTQVERVVVKFEAFTNALPNWQALHEASTAQVLTLWQGLGYNRRALWLHEAAHRIASEFNGQLPQTPEILLGLKGIGANTAGSIMAFAFNKPVVFIETNLRRAYIHHFFTNQQAVSDQAILYLIGATLDTKRPRQWYWALMDYGSYLRGSMPNPNRQSKHYSKQSKFEGSLRQIRGQVIRELTDSPQTINDLRIKIPDQRLTQALQALNDEGFVVEQGQSYKIREVMP